MGSKRPAEPSPELMRTFAAIDRMPKFHPLTCGGNRTDEAHKRYAEEHGEDDYGILVSGPSGLVCPVCGWKQPKDIGTQLYEAKNALKAIQSQCQGHADEFSRNVWLLACEGLGQSSQ